MISSLILATAIAATASQAAVTDTAAVSLDNVVVTGTRQDSDPRHLPMTINQISRTQLTSNERTSVLPTLSEQVPGLFVTSRGIIGYGVSTGSAGAIKVRGIGGMGSLLVLVDGLPQYAGLYGHPVADAYQTMLAQKVEVLRGPASTIYGSNAMGGVVNIVTRHMQQNGSLTNVNLQGGSYGTFEGSASNNFRHNRFSSTAGVNYSRTDGHRANSEFEQVSGFVKLGYDLSQNWSLVGNANVTYFESSNPGTVDNPLLDNDMKITRGMAALSLTNDYGTTSGALRTYYNWGHHNINDGYSPGGTPRTALYLHDDLMAGISAYESMSLFTGNRTTVGFDWQHYGGEAWNRTIADGTRTDIADKTLDEIGAYIDLRQSITTWMTLDAAIRYDHNSHTGSEWVPQGGLSFILPHNATLKAMVSKGFRNPTIREMYMYRAANADLLPERMMNYELSYKQHLLERRLTVGASVFYLKADNLIATIRQDGRNINVNTGATEHWGIELEGAYRINQHLSLHANYSFLHMSVAQLAAPEHKAYVGADYTLGRFTITGGLQHIANLYTVQGDDAQTEDFTLLNLTAKYKLLKQLTLYIKGDNLLAQRYEINAGFPMPRATIMAGVDINF